MGQYEFGGSVAFNKRNIDEKFYIDEEPEGAK